ncbi:hypothetical protein OOK41_08620 [Micromonospora sp. NBC_01655]|uniref:hypothetical protein n=1 Tax=Micromonospora sp. NBC_01655 TaxID=2975983 RepID=UPI0022537AC5|nr:hypothetical protein [Micromonospora sp. NBC_01655]MCX4470366.1 hypothetical protein [Micromonospora sp. NBC_01655]
MSPTQVVVTVLVVLVVVAALVVVGRQAARRRALRSRFGPEYDRMVTERDSRSAAERELRDRERRHAELTLTPLTPESRARYAAAWEELQIRFVDSPAETVSDADELVGRLVAERGYPSGEFSDQVAHLSVEHARTLSHYRDAHEIRLRNERGEAGTEELRQAVVHYRALFADLLGEDPVGGRAPEQRRPDATPEHRADAGPDHRPDAGPDHQPDAGPADRPHDVTSR